MDEGQQNNRSQLFLVRLWLDREAGNDGLWRGKVQHVITGHVSVFDGHASLLEVLTSMVPGPAAPEAEQRSEQ